ncbi:MAG TPA: chitobiase/beta-hexosaminidase C-terminal domain-containing protein [Acidimicrobiales bacterium]|nr:chitobiase/beta-hexosaminidase C-terminal domain-containing protein [Acidimicrobiales bacterium]
MSPPRRGAEDGFTLVELLIVTVVVSIVMGALSSAIVVGLRTTDETTERLSDSHDLQLLSVYWPADVQSAVEGRIETGPVGAGCTGGPSESTQSRNVVRFTWDEPGGTQAFTANYRYEEDGDRHVLSRYSCVDGGTARDVVVVHGLGTSPPAITQSGRSITMELTLASGLTTRVTATRRTPGAVPPELDVTFPVNGGEYNDAGWDAGCSPSGLCGTASDSAGIQSVEVALLRVAVNLYWDGTAFASAAPVYGAATGTTSWSRAFAAAGFPAEGSYAVLVRATNAIGTQVSSTNTFVVDRSVPVTTDDTASIGSSWKNTDQTVTLSPTDAGGSGVDATYSTSDGSSPTTASTKGTSIALSAEGSFTVKYFSVDGAGNREAVKTAATAVRIDKTAPTSATLTLPDGGFVKNGAVLSATAADALSGIGSLELLYCSGTGCTPSIAAGSASASPAAVAWTGQPADGAYRMLVRARDLAGNSLDSAVQTVTVDNTAPAVSAAAVELVNGAGGNKEGTAEQDDKVTVGFSEKLRGSSLCSTWDANPTTTQSISGDNQVTVTITESGANDVLTLSLAGPCDNAFGFGSLALGGDWVSATTTFNGKGNKASTIAWDPATAKLTVELGEKQSGTVRTGVSEATATYTPASGLVDLAGNSLPAGAVASATKERF